MNRSFSRFITLALLGFVGITLAIVVGSLYGFLSTAMVREFSNKLLADQTEAGMALQDRFNLLEGRIRELSLNNALRVNLMLGVRSPINEILNSESIPIDGALFFVREKAADAPFIPEIPVDYEKLEPLLLRMGKAEKFHTVKFFQFDMPSMCTLYACPVMRKNEVLGTLYSIYDLGKDHIFWGRFHKKHPARLLIRNRDSLRDLQTLEILRLPPDFETLPEDRFLSPGFDFMPDTALIPLNKYPGVYFAASSSPLKEKKKTLFIVMGGICLGIFFLTLLLSHLLVRKITEPLENMVEQAHKISRDPSGSLLNEEAIRYREFQKLGRSFNAVLLNLFSARRQEQKAREFLNAILNTVADPVFVKDEDHRFITVNEAICALTGYSEEEMLNRTAYDLFPEREADFFHQQDANVLVTGFEDASEQRLTVSSGETRLVSAKKRALIHPETGRRVIVGVMQDVTEAKRLEHELARHRDHLSALVRERTSELEKTNRRLLAEIEDRQRAEQERKEMEQHLQRARKMEAIGTLAGGVAHDLNNILSGIVSYPDLLLMNLPEKSPLEKPILTIRKSGEKAAAIVQDLLTLARRGVSVTEILNLNDVVSDYLLSPEYQKLMAFHQGLAVRSIPDRDLLNITGSPVHLFKTVMNLVSNAAEAMPEGGGITIRTENRYVDKPLKGYDTVEEGDYAALIVSDTGVGIDEEDIDRIFEPFFTKKSMGRSGTGLGMAVVWGTVKDHRGYIDVHSVRGTGSRFTLLFPVTRKKRFDADAFRAFEEIRGDGEKILVIDDIPEQREIATEMLKKLNYDVLSLPSGEAALTYFEDRTADLILLDMIMDPGMDGLETYRRISRKHPELKAVIASGFSETERVREAQRLGAGEYVKKPYTIEKIGRAIRNALDDASSAP